MENIEELLQEKFAHHHKADYLKINNPHTFVKDGFLEVLAVYPPDDNNEDQDELDSTILSQEEIVMVQKEIFSKR